MFENYQVCPYTGLRSFTEEESLYFKGRDEDIDLATAQLQRNKFLMLTGASGDGKSSLIYAGIIPNARAGFLKSKYSQWCIADFRPERTPFVNLCRALAKQLDIPNEHTVQAELNHGFSALADLYRNSKRFVDINSSSWQNEDEKGKATLRRDAANLIILVDQFEEFFTNPENYNHGAPSKDANLVLNILLETARIALDEDLPIYIVFTMRSDYIGQCAAFRGLPEYIGFSQFFVPRLNRSQLRQIIEEPATLSGNRIAYRLTERLIHDLNEGVDQLPILQHALNQVWVAASQGNEEMDLIHYAMVGGMNAKELPDDQVGRFEEWYVNLPPVIRDCYHAPGLQNVLDTHCNKLYEEAADYYNKKTGGTLAAADAKKIIRTAFTCLTKIDQSRAVRNRMTLQEIVNILGIDRFDTVLVGQVLNLFREPGNTFIHPFIAEEHPESQVLAASQVLDITHESLIRNWLLLGQWAREEFESLSISIDFEQQLGRWVNSGKSNNFLLSIGPLTYFESWFNKSQPNAQWIARYLPEGTNKEDKLEKANTILSNSREFISRSADKHIVTRTLMRYGPKRIAAVLGILALITLSSFAISSYYKKQNAYVLKNIHQQSLKLMANPKVALDNKVTLICEELKLGLTTVDESVLSVTDSITRINIANGIAARLLFQGKDEPADKISRSLFLADSLLENFVVPLNNPLQLSALLKEANDLRVNLAFAGYYNADRQFKEWAKKNATRSGKLVKLILTKEPEKFSDIPQLVLALENAINYQGFTESDLKEILNLLSPFENGLQSPWLQSSFDIDKGLIRGGTGYGFAFNGLYQELAYLYAATGNSAKVLQCIDSLLKYSQNNYQGDYAAGADNAANIAAVFYLNGKTTELDEFITGYCTRKKVDVTTFYDQLLGRTLPGLVTTANFDLFFWTNVHNNINLKFASDSMLAFFGSQHRTAISKSVKTDDEKSFLTALSFKNEGIRRSLNAKKADDQSFNPAYYFDQAFLFIRKVSPSFLSGTITMISKSAVDQMMQNRKALFFHPDIRMSAHPNEPRSFFYFQSSPVFMEYIFKNNLFPEFYTSPGDIKQIEYWLDDYNTKSFAPTAFMRGDLSYDFLKRLEKELSNSPFSSQADLNLLYLYLGRAAQVAGDSTEMVRYYKNVKVNNLFNILRSKEFSTNVNDQSFRMIAYAIKGLTYTGNLNEAHRFVTFFKNPINRSSLYAFVANDLMYDRADLKLVQPLLDSAKAEMNRAENINQDQPNRELIAPAMVMYSPSNEPVEAYRLIKNIPEKFSAVRSIGRAYAFYGRLYDANATIPEIISDSDLALYYTFLLLGYGEGKKVSDGNWKKYLNYYVGAQFNFIRYTDENS